MQVGVRQSLWNKQRKYDYRVAYFQRIVVYPTGYFILPTFAEMNSNIIGGDTSIRQALAQSSYEYSWTLGIAPGSNISGDKHMFGNVGIIFGGLYYNKWRPGGIGQWPTSPTTTQFPLLLGNAVKATFSNNGYDMQDSDQHYYSLSYTQDIPDTTGQIPILVSDGTITLTTSTYALVGTRFFASSFYNSHQLYGINANYICVIKDDAPYIYDTINNVFCSKLGGEIGIGPKVADNWNPLTWHDPQS